MDKLNFHLFFFMQSKLQTEHCIFVVLPLIFRRLKVVREAISEPKFYLLNLFACCNWFNGAHISLMTPFFSTKFLDNNY